MATSASPPGRLSTITGWPQRWLRRSASRRAPMSAPLPTPSGTMNLTGRVGHLVSAEAVAAHARWRSKAEHDGKQARRSPRTDSSSSFKHAPDIAVPRVAGPFQLSNPVGTFLFSLSSFMPAASAMVSASAAKSFCRYSSGFFCSVAAPKWLCSTSRVAAVTGIGTSISRASSRPRSRSLRSSSGVNVVVQSRLTNAGDL